VRRVDFVEMGCLFEFQIRQNPCEITHEIIMNHFESFSGIMAHLSANWEATIPPSVLKATKIFIHHGGNSPPWLQTAAMTQL